MDIPQKPMRLLIRLSAEMSIQKAQAFNISETFRIPEKLIIFELRNLT